MPAATLQAPSTPDIIALIEACAFDDAIALCKTRLSHDIHDPAANHLAAVALRGRGQAQLALDFHARAVAKAPTRADYLYELGRSFAALKLRSEAAQAFATAEKLDPKEVQFALASARCLAEAEDPSALQKAEEIVIAHPCNTEALDFKASVLLALGQRDAALEALQHSHRLAPDNPAALYMLAKHLPLEACTDLDTALTAQARRNQ